MKGAPYPVGDLNPRPSAALDFPATEPGAMTPADWETLGFLAGLEVHQQLRTRRKLFCRCPAGVYVESCDAEVLRHMRPTLSELGEYDGCALMEFKTRKEIVYLLDRGTVCTYEIDDTPPFPIDEEAVRGAIAVATAFDLSLVSELHVMRKQYLDGSIPTGFQRTAMIGLAGEIPFRVPSLGVDRSLRIRQISLEEDSCREVSDAGHRIIFRTDRLGMPLSEVVTEADARTPEELQAVARLVAATTRAAGPVRRGPGAARQDVNVSIAGSRRVEIKGVDRHRGLPRLVHREAFRQLELLRLRAELVGRGVSADMLAIPPAAPGDKAPAWEISGLAVDATSLLRSCDYAPVREALSAGATIGAVRLPGFGGLLTHATQPGLTFANELADRVRVIACLVGRPFLVHSDLGGYGLSPGEWRQVKAALGAGDRDAAVVAWGPRRDVDTALREVLLRATEALDGVPAETRQAFPDGTTGFERVLPGADRMYPDTDTPPFPVPDAWVEEIRTARPERPWERSDRYAAAGVPAAAAVHLAAAPWAPLFDALAPAAGAVARRVAFALERRLPRLVEPRTGAGVPDAERLAPLVRALESGDLRPEGFERALARVLAEPDLAPDAAVGAFRPRPDDESALASRVAETLAEAGQPGAPADPEATLRWAMGRTIGPLRGRVDPARARAALRAGLESPAAEGAR